MPWARTKFDISIDEANLLGPDLWSLGIVFPYGSNAMRRSLFIQGGAAKPPSCAISNKTHALASGMASMMSIQSISTRVAIALTGVPSGVRKGIFLARLASLKDGRIELVCSVKRIGISALVRRLFPFLARREVARAGRTCGVLGLLVKRVTDLARLVVVR